MSCTYCTYALNTYPSATQGPVLVVLGCMHFLFCTCTPQANPNYPFSLQGDYIEKNELRGHIYPKIYPSATQGHILVASGCMHFPFCTHAPQANPNEPSLLCRLILLKKNHEVRWPYALKIYTGVPYNCCLPRILTQRYPRLRFGGVWFHISLHFLYSKLHQN